MTVDALTGPQTRLADPSDFDAIVDMLVDAYEDDPVMNYGFRGGRHRHSAWAVYFRAIVERYHKWKGVVVHASGDGAAVWAPPHRWEVTNLDKLRNVPKLPAMLGARTPRGMRIMSLMQRHHPTAPHYYLNIVAVQRSRQGRGIGGQLLNDGLRTVDAQGLPAYLESSNARNVPLYERAGFATQELINIGGGVRMWLMWREAQP